MIPRLTLLVLAAALLLPLPARAGAPSFDCASAKLPVERTICRSATLAAMDVEIAEAYGRAMQNLSNGMRATLLGAQRTFLAARNEAFGLPDEDLEVRLADQIAFLKGIEARGRTTIEGSWRNGFGGVEVARRPDGTVEVSIATADPVRARWLCDLQGEARSGPSGWVVEADPGPMDDWTVTLTPRGGQLTVAAAAAGGRSAGGGEPPFCGNGGRIDGDYLPIRPQVDWAQ